MAVRSVLRAALLMMFIGIAFQGCNLFKQKTRIEQAVELHETVFSEAVRIFQTDFKKYSIRPIKRMKSTGKHVGFIGNEFFATVDATVLRIAYAALEDVVEAGRANVPKLTGEFSEKLSAMKTNVKCSALQNVQEVEFAKIVKEDTIVPLDFPTRCVSLTTQCYNFFIKMVLEFSEDIQDSLKETH
eukprot:GEMP01073132.1.p1 GENE.GEMP01073132.1~~GEMP01073132.1.p1  ORF type:complete len:186 (+),score=17.30 GEMP01073132.1:135-692(+)